LLRRQGASYAYRLEEDSRKLFSADLTAPVALYLRSSDGYALDISSVGGVQERVAVGVRTSEAGKITFSFSGMESFDGKQRIYFQDTKENRVIDLRVEKEYSFIKAESDGLYLENRFYLTFENFTTGLQEVKTSPVSIGASPQGIHILSNDGSPLGNVRIFDAQGNCLMNGNLSAPSYLHPVNTPGIYIVRVKNEMKKVKN
jgi:hypothetical protein